MAAVQQLSERVRKEKEELFSTASQIDIERLQVLLEVYRETEGEPAIMRRAKLFNTFCRRKTLWLDNNPLVGTLSRFKAGGNLSAEWGGEWMSKQEEFQFQRGKARPTPEQRAVITDALNYWRNQNLFKRTRQTVLESKGVDIITLLKCGIGIEFAPLGAVLTGPDYGEVLNKGLKGILAEIATEKAKVSTDSPGGISKFYFYKASSLCLEGMIELASRYASLARDMAKKEKDPARKKELQLVAETCAWVPANPARTFYEAIQAVWFTILGIYIETPAILFSPPSRFTQYMYPFFKKDKAAGRITDAEAIELIQFLFLKINGIALAQSEHSVAWNQSRLGMQLTLGSLTRDGDDATNELDYLVLEAQRQIQLPEPLVNVVYHDQLSEDFLLKCVELIRTGIGQPAMHNSRPAMEGFLHLQKAPLEDARNVSVAGCVQPCMVGYTDFTWLARANVAKMFELALNDGKDPLTQIQVGPKTGKAESFKTFDELYQAFVQQVNYFVPLMCSISGTAWTLVREFLPVPFGSSFVHDCIPKGKDESDGGARYGLGEGICLCGVIDAANSLTAVKDLVFDKKTLSMAHLKEALAADFEGHEDVYKMCLEAPKYGNDDPAVDAVTRDIYNNICYRANKPTDFLGRPATPSAYSVTAHFALGRWTGALPNGRKKGRFLTDASISAQAGTDKNGPTALVRSAARAIDTAKYHDTHFNMKFHPTALAGMEGARKFLGLIKTYFDLGGYHVQFNCVSGETLRDAQLHPAKYKNLIVRVAGFSAYFVALDQEVQNDVIARTELKL